MCSTTRAAFEKTSVRPEQVTGISFCSQMQGMVLVDEHANALRRPMSYMDQRAGAEFRACQTHGLTISGVNAGMMLRSLAATHAASTSVKDPPTLRDRACQSLKRQFSELQFEWYHGYCDLQARLKILKWILRRAFCFPGGSFPAIRR